MVGKLRARPSSSGSCITLRVGRHAIWQVGDVPNAALRLGQSRTQTACTRLGVCRPSSTRSNACRIPLLACCAGAGAGAQRGGGPRCGRRSSDSPLPMHTLAGAGAVHLRLGRSLVGQASLTRALRSLLAALCVAWALQRLGFEPSLPSHITSACLRFREQRRLRIDLHFARRRTWCEHSTHHRPAASDGIA